MNTIMLVSTDARLKMKKWFNTYGLNWQQFFSSLGKSDT